MLQNSKSIWVIVILFLLTMFSVASAWAQSGPAEVKAQAERRAAIKKEFAEIRKRTLPATTESLERWLKDVARLNSWSEETPAISEEILLQLLQQGRFVTDAAILSVVRLWQGHESRTAHIASNTTGKRIEPDFIQSKRIIDSVLPLLYGRPGLQAGLYEQKALLLFSASVPQSLNAYNDALSLLDTVHIDADLRRMEITSQMAGLNESIGNRQQADELYWEVLHYPWWKVRIAQPHDQLFELHIRAGESLINLRAGNLRALKDLSLRTLANPLEEKVAAAIANAQIQQGVTIVAPPNAPSTQNATSTNTP